MHIPYPMVSHMQVPHNTPWIFQIPWAHICRYHKILCVRSISYGHTYAGTTQYSCTFYILWSHISRYHTILWHSISYGLTYVGTTQHSDIPYPMVSHTVWGGVGWTVLKYFSPTFDWFGAYGHKDNRNTPYITKGVHISITEQKLARKRETPKRLYWNNNQWVQVFVCLLYTENSR